MTLRGGFVFPWIAVAVILGFNQACQTEGVSGDPASDAYHHDEIPAHKPLHFAGGVDEIRRLAFSENLTAKDIGVLADLFAWLPELAAESDLSEAQWLSLRTASDQGERWVVAAQSTMGAKPGTSGDLTTDQRAALVEVWKSLAPWCQYESLREPIYDGRHAH
jgi:hypothetical protein